MHDDISFHCSASMYHNGRKACACLKPSLLPILARFLQLLLPPCVNARQRAALHAAAEACGLTHASQGEGAARRLLLESAASDEAEACIDPVTMGNASMDDGALETLLGDCFGGQLAAAFRTAVAERTAPADTKPARTPPAKATRPCDVSRFAETMRSLLEQEQRAEVACAEQSLDSEATSSQDRVLPHLRLADVEPGLLGRSLLVLVNNKVIGGSGV